MQQRLQTADQRELWHGAYKPLFDRATSALCARYIKALKRGLDPWFTS
jgi:hypothetical protein